MDTTTIFFLTIILSFVISGLIANWYVMPWLKARGLEQALTPLLIIHIFRFTGLAFLVPGVVASDLPTSFAEHAAYGDFITAWLAFIALVTIRRNSSSAFLHVWLFNIVGTLDLLYAVFQGYSNHINPGQLGVMYFIPTVGVPALLVTHIMIFVLLIKVSHELIRKMIRRSLWLSIARALVLTFAIVILFFNPGILVYTGNVGSVSFTSGEIKLAGILSKPSGVGPFPAIVVIHGSGPATHTEIAYKIHANAFTSAGFAVLVYDKRGCGNSTGNWEKSDLADLAGDVTAAVRYLRTRSDILPNKVGLFGRSQGGWIGPLASTLVDGIAFIISSAGPSIPPWEDGLYQIEVRLRSNGFSERDIHEATTLRKRVWDYYRRAGETNDKLAEERDSLGDALTLAQKKPWFEPAENLPQQLPPFDREQYAKTASLQYFEPLPVLTRVDCPMLFVFGQEDDRVPTEKCAAILEELRKEHSKDISVKVFPGVGHALMTWRGFPAFYVPGYLDLIADWAKQNIAADQHHK